MTVKLLTQHDTTRLDAAIMAELTGAVKAQREQLTGDGSHAHALAIGMVDDLTGFFVAVDTLESAANVAKSETPEDRPSYWWSPSEWGWQYEDEHGAAPGAVTEAIWELRDNLPDDADDTDDMEDEAYAALRTLYEERVTVALEKLRAEGQLKNAHGDELWVWLHYADAFDEDIDDRTFARLQDAPTTALFTERWDGGLSDALQERIKNIAA